MKKGDLQLLFYLLFNIIFSFKAAHFFVKCPAATSMNISPCESRWDVSDEGVVFLGRIPAMKPHEQQEAVVDQVTRPLRGCSPGMGGGAMRRAKSPRKLEYSCSALQPPRIFHNGKRLGHVLLSLLGRDFSNSSSNRKPLTGLELRPHLLNRTDDDTDITIDAATIDAVCRSESAMGYCDDLHNQFLPRTSPPEGAQAANIYGPGTFQISISSLKKITRSVKIASGSCLPPAFVDALTAFISRVDRRMFFWTRKNIPLREMGCEHRWAALRQYHCDGCAAARNRIAALGEPPSNVNNIAVEVIAQRSAIYTAKQCLLESEESLRSLDRVIEGRVCTRQFEDFLEKVRKNSTQFGFRSSNHAEITLSRSLSHLSESLVMCQEGYCLVDGAHLRYNQLTAKTPTPIHFISVAQLSDPQCAAVDMITLRCRLRTQFLLSTSLARHHNLNAISGSLLIGEPPYGVSLSSLREASIRALLEVLSDPEMLLQYYYISVPDEACCIELCRLLDAVLTPGGVYNDPQSSRHLRTTIIIHEKDPKFVACELAKRAFSTGLIVPSSMTELLQGIPGGHWETGRGNSFSQQEDTAQTTTMLLSDINISGRDRFCSHKILFEDTEGWGISSVKQLGMSEPVSTKSPIVTADKIEITSQASSPTITATIGSPIPHDIDSTPLESCLVCISFRDESCVVEVSSLPDAETITRESFDTVAPLPPGSFYLSYSFEKKNRIVKTDKHFKTFLSLAFSGRVATDGGLPELVVKIRQKDNQQIQVSEQPLRIQSPEKSSCGISPEADSLCIDSQPMLSPSSASLELRTCSSKLAELEAEQRHFEETREWYHNLINIEVRNINTAGPGGNHTISVHQSNIACFNRIKSLIQQEVSYDPLCYCSETGGSFLSLTDDETWSAFIKQCFIKNNPYIVYVEKPPTEVRTRAVNRLRGIPEGGVEVAIINLSFNPPSMKVIGSVEQGTIESLSSALIEVCPQIVRYRKGKRVPQLKFAAKPQPHWTVTYPHSFCDQTAQSMLSIAALDVMEQSGGWSLKETASCTSPIGNTDNHSPVMVDFYKFIMVRSKNKPIPTNPPVVKKVTTPHPPVRWTQPVQGSELSTAQVVSSLSNENRNSAPVQSPVPPDTRKVNTKKKRARAQTAGVSPRTASSPTEAADYWPGSPMRALVVEQKPLLKNNFMPSTNSQPITNTDTEEVTKMISQGVSGPSQDSVELLLYSNTAVHKSGVDDSTPFDSSSSFVSHRAVRRMPSGPALFNSSGSDDQLPETSTSQPKSAAERVLSFPTKLRRLSAGRVGFQVCVLLEYIIK